MKLWWCKWWSSVDWAWITAKVMAETPEDARAALLNHGETIHPYPYGQDKNKDSLTCEEIISRVFDVRELD